MSSSASVGSVAASVADFVGPHLQADEHMEATLTSALTGASWPVISVASTAAAIAGCVVGTWFVIGPLRTIVMVAAAAAVTGWILITLVARSHAIALTSQRLLVIRRSARSGQLGAIEGAYPRSAVRLIGYRPGTLFGSLKVDLPGESILSLSFLSSARRGAGQIADALKVPAAA